VRAIFETFGAAGVFSATPPVPELDPPPPELDPPVDAVEASVLNVVPGDSGERAPEAVTPETDAL